MWGGGVFVLFAAGKGVGEWVLIDVGKFFFFSFVKVSWR